MLLSSVAVPDKLICKPELKMRCVYPMEAPVAVCNFRTVLETGHGHKLASQCEQVFSAQHYAKLTIVKQLG